MAEYDVAAFLMKIPSFVKRFHMIPTEVFLPMDQQAVRKLPEVPLDCCLFQVLLVWIEHTSQSLTTFLAVPTSRCREVDPGPLFFTEGLSIFLFWGTIGHFKTY